MDVKNLTDAQLRERQEAITAELDRRKRDEEEQKRVERFLYNAQVMQNLLGEWVPTAEQQAFLDRKFKAATGRG